MGLIVLVITPSTPNSPTKSDRLLSGQRLLIGNAIDSVDGRFNMILQNDGNLVLSYVPQRVPLWSSNTQGYLNIVDVLMQTDGNLVLRDNNNNSFWESNTSSTGAILILHDNGNAAIHDINNATLWETKTVVPITPGKPTSNDRLMAGQGLMSGDSISSGNGCYDLLLQQNGILVQYGPDNKVIWALNMSGNPAIWDMIMQPDGNVVVYDFWGQSQWASDTNGNNGAVLVAEDIGALVIYDAQNKSIWSTGITTSFTPKSTTTETSTSTVSINQKSHSSRDAVIVGVVLAVMVLILLGCSMYLWLDKRKRGRVEAETTRGSVRRSANLDPRRSHSVVRVSIN